MRRVSRVVTRGADPTANIIFGAVINDQYDGKLHVTIIATGFSATFEDDILSGKLVRSRPPAPLLSHSLE